MLGEFRGLRLNAAAAALYCCCINRSERHAILGMRLKVREEPAQRLIDAVGAFLGNADCDLGPVVQKRQLTEVLDLGDPAGGQRLRFPSRAASQSHVRFVDNELQEPVFCVEVWRERKLLATFPPA